MVRLNQRHILVAISGGIAAYKGAELVRLLKKQGALVRVVLSRGATEFITPLTMQALSGEPTHTELLDEAAEAGMGHIELARWADLMIIAPATADVIARLAQGRADDLLTTVALDAVLSKSFGLFGMLNVAPYVGWSFVMIAATSRVIDPTPVDEGDPQQNFVFDELGVTNRLNHKLTFGVRLLVYVVNISVQGELQMLADYPTGGGAVSTVTTKLGLDF